MTDVAGTSPDVAARHSRLITALDKGFPGDARPLQAGETGSQGWNVLREDLPLPVAVLKEGALRRNAEWMRRFTERSGVSLAPHGKTTMAPALFGLQLHEGAWGITVATPHQLRVAVAFGCRRIVVANQIVGRAAIDHALGLIENDPELELYCLVDSPASLEAIERAADARGQRRRLSVLVEKGFAGGRTGARTVEGAMEVARAVARSRHLELAGVEGFEALIRAGSVQETLDAIRVFLDEVVHVAEQCDREGLFRRGPVILSAGGSAFFDMVADVFARADLAGGRIIVLRSGCYITHDSGMYTYAFTYLRERAPELFEDGGLEPALEVWGYVQSRPEPGRAIVAIGKRDVSHDQMPVPESWYRPEGGADGPRPVPPGHAIVKLDDQHGYMDVPEDSPLRVGDMVSFGISHPCLTFDKWRVIHLVDAGYTVTGSVETYF